MTASYPTSTRTLILMRHAKAEHTLGVEDIDRALTPRGCADARRAGEELAVMLGAPSLDAVASSPSVRTRQTWAGVGKSVDCAEVWFDRSLYGADVGELLRLVHELPESARTALVIGHNPTMAQAALHLADAGPARERMAEKFPTSAIAVLEIEGEWADAAPGNARLLHFRVPRA